MLMSSMIGVVALFCVLSICRADVYPGPVAFQDICQEIIGDVTADAIRLREFVTNCGPSGCTISLQIRETLTQQALCERLTEQHNTHNAGHLGASMVTVTECDNAFESPLFYAPNSWNNWAGRHCGHWKNTNQCGTVTDTFTDHALWDMTDVSGGVNGFYTQSVMFLTRPGTCCNNGWNQSGLSVSQKS